VITLPAWKTFLASWHANDPLPLTWELEAEQCLVSKGAGIHLGEILRSLGLRPAGTKTVLPSRDPLYIRSACSAVTPASGIAAASAKERLFGLTATKYSSHLAYSLHDPVRNHDKLTDRTTL